MNRTTIEWVKNPDGSQGYTWNPITGCLNGCPYCYARTLSNGRLRSRYLANNVLPTHDEPEHEKHHCDPFYPRFWDSRLEELRHRNCKLIEQGLDNPRGIFACDMSDLFGKGVPMEWTEAVLNEIDNKHDRFYLLTNQPQNLDRFSPFPDNCWIGFTATQDRPLQYGLAHIAEVEAKVKFISFEPLLEKMSFLAAEMVDWVIIGAMTCGGGEISELASQYPQLTEMPSGGRYTLQPRIEWVKEIVEVCDRAGTKVFLKENLRPLLENDHRAFMNPLYWRDGYYTSPEHPNIDLHLRQEMPL